MKVRVADPMVGVAVVLVLLLVVESVMVVVVLAGVVVLIVVLSTSHSRPLDIGEHADAGGIGQYFPLRRDPAWM